MMNKKNPADHERPDDNAKRLREFDGTDEDKERLEECAEQLDLLDWFLDEMEEDVSYKDAIVAMRILKKDPKVIGQLVRKILS